MRISAPSLSDYNPGSFNSRAYHTGSATPSDDYSAPAGPVVRTQKDIDLLVDKAIKLVPSYSRSKLTIKIQKLERAGISGTTKRSLHSSTVSPKRAAPRPSGAGDASRRGAKPHKSARATVTKPDARKSDPPQKGTRKEEIRDFKCKERPKDATPKGGGGSGKKFIPWC